MLVKYTQDDVGCYADGAFGHIHVRSILSDLVRVCDSEIADILKGEMSDDLWEEDAAIDLLNEHCAPDVFWTFNDGDLILTSSEEEQ